MASRKAKWLQKQMRRIEKRHHAKIMDVTNELIACKRTNFELHKRLESETSKRRELSHGEASDAAVVLFRRGEQTSSGPVYHFGVTIDSRWLHYQMHKSADCRFTDFSEIQYDIERTFHDSLTKLIEEIANK